MSTEAADQRTTTAAPWTGAGPPAPHPGQPPWAHVRPTNTKAILAVSLLAFAPAAIVFGVLARREIRRTGEGGWGLATWGMGLGIGIVSLYVLYLVAFIALYGVIIAAAVTTGAATGSGF